MRKNKGVIAPGEAWGRGKRCNDYNSETFRWDSMGSQSHPVERAGSRKRVLRGGGRPSSRSVDSQTESSDIEPRNFSGREPSLLTQAGAAPTRRNGLACWSHRGPRPERTVSRVLQEPGRSVVSNASIHRPGRRRTPSPWLSGSAPGTGGSERAGAALVSPGERNEPAKWATEVGASS